MEEQSGKTPKEILDELAQKLADLFVLQIDEIAAQRQKQTADINTPYHPPPLDGP